MHQNVSENNSELETMVAAFKGIGDAVILIDTDKNINYINIGAEKLTGFHKREALGKNIADIFCITSEFMIGNIETLIDETFERNSPIGLKKDTLLKSKDGSSHYISASLSCIKNSNNTLFGVVVVFRDISRIRRLESIIEMERNNYMTIFENMPLGIILIDNKLKIKQLNPSAINLFDITKSNFTGQVLGDAIKCVNSLQAGCGNGDSCEKCNLTKLIVAAFLEKNYLKNEVYNLKFKKGEESINNSWFKLNFSPLKTQYEELIIIIIEDVTLQINHQQQLQKAFETSIRMLDNLPVMVWKSNLDNQIDYVNNTFQNFIFVKNTVFRLVLCIISS